MCKTPGKRTFGSMIETFNSNIYIYIYIYCGVSGKIFVMWNVNIEIL